MHMLTNAKRLPVRCKASAAVPASRAPDAPSGCPSAIAPPQGPPPLTPAVPPAAAGFVDPATLTAETWCEAWTWRPDEWPGQSLDLNVVEHNEPTKALSPGQVFPGQFSFGGISPAPTIRVRAGGTIRIRLRNLLGENFGRMWVGPCPDPLSITPALLLEFQQQIAKSAGKPVPKEIDPDFNPAANLDELGAFLGVKAYEWNEAALGYRPQDKRLQYNRQFLRDSLYDRLSPRPARLNLGSGGKPASGWRRAGATPRSTSSSPPTRRTRGSRTASTTRTTGSSRC
jgi:hypothetical protein